MQLFSSLLERARFILFGDLFRKLDRLARQIQLLEESMTITEAQVLAAIEQNVERSPHLEALL